MRRVTYFMYDGKHEDSKWEVLLGLCITIYNSVTKEEKDRLCSRLNILLFYWEFKKNGLM